MPFAAPCPPARIGAASSSPGSLPGHSPFCTSNSLPLSLCARSQGLPGTPRPGGAQGALKCPAAPRSRVPRLAAAGCAARAGAGLRRVALGRGPRSAGGAGRPAGRGLPGLAAPGGGRAGNVACAPGNAPIALSPRRARSVWSLLALMGTDSAVGAGQGRGRGAGSGGDSGTRAPAPLPVRTGAPDAAPGGHRALTSHHGKRARRPELGSESRLRGAREKTTESR